jgi:hypothetical protein
MMVRCHRHLSGLTLVKDKKIESHMKPTWMLVGIYLLRFLAQRGISEPLKYTDVTKYVPNHYLHVGMTTGTSQASETIAMSDPM